MANIFNKNTIALQRERPLSTFVTNPVLPTSGSAILDAGWTFEESDPVSGSIGLGSGSFFDGDRQTAVTPAEVSTNWSLVMQLQSGSFRSVNMYDSGSADIGSENPSYGGWFVSGSNSSITTYFTNSWNGSRWTKWRTLIAPVRSQFSGSIFKTEIVFPSAITANWIKLHASDGALKGPEGEVLRISEVEVFNETKLTTISGSAFNQYGLHLTSTSTLGVSQSGGDAADSPAGGFPGQQS